MAITLSPNIFIGIRSIQRNNINYASWNLMLISNRKPSPIYYAAFVLYTDIIMKKKKRKIWGGKRHCTSRSESSSYQSSFVVVFCFNETVKRIWPFQTFLSVFFIHWKWMEGKLGTGPRLDLIKKIMILRRRASLYFITSIVFNWGLLFVFFWITI
jgi:hypothetical protein